MKKVKFILIFVNFILACICHFVYDFNPNFVTSLLFPVNESIFEHMKLIITPVLLSVCIEFIIYKYKNIKYNNFILANSISIFLGIFIYLLIYLPINGLIGYNSFVAVTLLFLIFILIQIISYYILNYKKIKYNILIGITIIIVLYLIFGYFTYFPPDNKLFISPN